jgi:hypothetical protein
VTFRGEEIAVAPIIFMDPGRLDVDRGETVFDHMVECLMVVEKRGDRWLPKDLDGKPMLLQFRQVRGFLEKLGLNSSYLIHPEEVLADNFKLLLTGAKRVPTPRVLEDLRRVLAENRAGTGEESAEKQLQPAGAQDTQ